VTETSEAPEEALPELGPILSLKQFEAIVEAKCALPWHSLLGGRMLSEYTNVRPKRDWLLKGVVLARTFVLIVGAPGCGKSFLALDLAMTMAVAAVSSERPQQWFGRKIKPCGIVYIAAEGQDDFIIRIQGWLLENGLPLDLDVPFFLIPTPIDMRTGDVDTEKLISDIKGFQTICRLRFGCDVGMVFIDTLNRALAGGDDGNPEHIGKFVKHAAQVRDITGLCVAALHHTPKPQANSSGKITHIRSDPRGHSSLRGDNDGEIFVTEGDGARPNRWKVERNKAGPKGDWHEFRLHEVIVGIDDDGENIPTCIVQPGGSERAMEGYEVRDRAEATKGKPNVDAFGRALVGPNLTLDMEALQSLLDTKGDFPPTDIRIPAGRKAIKMEDWTDEIVSRRPGDTKDAKFKDAVRKHRDTAAINLRMRGIIDMDGPWVWRTERKVAGVDKVEDSPFGGPNPPSSSDGIQW
jgi:AAA domain